MCAPGHQPSDGSRESCFKDHSHSFEFEEAAREPWSILLSEVRPKGHGLVAGEKVTPADDTRRVVAGEGGGHDPLTIRTLGPTFGLKGTDI